MRHPQANRDIGAWFETLFQWQGRRRGLLIRKNELSARRIGAGRVQTMKSELDFTLIQKPGRVGYFDCKAFDDSGFTFSKLKPHQLKRAIEYNDWGVPAGFVGF